MPLWFENERANDWIDIEEEQGVADVAVEASATRTYWRVILASSSS